MECSTNSPKTLQIMIGDYIIECDENTIGKPMRVPLIKGELLCPDPEQYCK